MYKPEIKCINCRFRKEPKELPEDWKGPKPNGTCRRYPPTFIQRGSHAGVIAVGGPPIVTHDYMCVYPEVLDDNWCGEWFDKDEEWPPESALRL